MDDTKKVLSNRRSSQDKKQTNIQKEKSKLFDNQSKNVDSLDNVSEKPFKTEDDKISDEELPWIFIKSYFNNNPAEKLVRHQIESYNNIIKYQIQKTIEMFNKSEPILSQKEYNPQFDKYSLEMNVSFDNLQFDNPQIYELNGVKNTMLPNKARLRGCTYSSSMYLDVNIETIVRNGENMNNIQIYNKKISRLHIGKLPIMLKSDICMLKKYKHIDPLLLGECKYDSGGYFIINGSEKTVIAQERACENKIYVYLVKNNAKYIYQAEVRSIPDFKCISPKQINMMICSKNNGFGYPIVVQLPRVKHPIPLFVLFRALGVLSDKEICSYILLNVDEHINTDVNYKKNLLLSLKASIHDSSKYLTKEDCFKFLTTNVMYTVINPEKDNGLKKKHMFALDILNNDLFPHCTTFIQKIYYLGYMTYKILLVQNNILQQDDRDSHINKRIDLTGILINNLFRNYFNKFVKDMERSIIKEIDIGTWRTTEDYQNIISPTNIYKIFKSTTIENGIKKALSTGDFTIRNGGNNNTNTKVGVAQVLNRLNYPSTLSHLRRISTPTDKSGKLIPPRKLHNTTWGFICPAETPEGASVGIVKNLSVMCHITIPSDPTPIHDYFTNLSNNYISNQNQENPIYVPIDLYDTTYYYNKVKIFVNGSFIGITNNPIQLYNDLKDKKYKGVFNIYTSIIFDYMMKEIKICNDAGRLTRPVFRINPETNMPYYDDNIIRLLNENKLEWDDLLIDNEQNDDVNIYYKKSNKFTNNNNNNTNIPIDIINPKSYIKKSIIEYIDPDEQMYSLISVDVNTLELNKKSSNPQKYTHCEIHPSTIFGILASCIPFPERNQSPRNTYQSAQAKQAIGVYATNYYERFDKTANILNYPQKPLVETRLMNIINLNKIPSGYNAIVAIAIYDGYNQEDSLLINKGSIDRGMFMATIYDTEKDEDKQKINGDEEIRCKPDPNITRKMKFANYDKLNNLGFVPENTLIENKDIIIAKIVPIKENKNNDMQKIKYEDQSKMYRTSEETYIDRNYMNKNGDGYNFAKVKLRTTRKPEIGDKFASRAGQKGTTGRIIEEHNIPFTTSGIKPDIIINPHAIPSRMTIAQLMETLLTRVLIELGLFGDGTSFGTMTVEFIAQKLHELGYESYGNEVLYDPLSGKQMNCLVFMGPVFYQRLKHMVNDKVHSRANGIMVNLTRQPMEGRSREGGLRFGEMERDATIAHGMARFTKERLYDSSDKFIIYVCKDCGMRASCNNKENIYYCNNCSNTTNFRAVEYPYASKLFEQELQAMNIGVRYITNI